MFLGVELVSRLDPERSEADDTAPAPGRLWVADITYVRTNKGWLYLAAIVDSPMS